MEKTNKIPVTIITGFLGSGKTTFLNYVMTVHHGNRIAVIQNEFGEELRGIEEAVVYGAQGNSFQQWVDLPNGCLCCTAKDNLLVAVENLIKNAPNRFDYIFVECSGMAEPGDVAKVFWVDDELESDVYLDGIITLVDAKHILQHLNEEKPKGTVNESQRQIAFADRIIINKLDLVSDSEVSNVEIRIRQINKLAPILKTERSRVPLNEILNINAFDMERAIEIDPHLVEECEKHHHEHDDTVTTVTLIEEGEVDLHEFNSWLGSWLWKEEQESDIDVFRCKGVVAIRDDPEKHVLQGVHQLFDVEPISGLLWKENEKRVTKLVFIGRRLDISALRATFVKSCLNKT